MTTKYTLEHWKDTNEWTDLSGSDIKTLDYPVMGSNYQPSADALRLFRLASPKAFVPTDYDTRAARRLI